MSEQNEDKKAKAPRTAGAAKEDKGGKSGAGGKGGKGAGRGAAKETPEEKAERQANLKPAGPSRLRAYYRDTVVGELTKKFGYKSVMQVPSIKKIVLNMREPRSVTMQPTG